MFNFWWQKSDQPDPVEPPQANLSQEQIQPFIQQLYEDEGLTSALTDEGAKILLDWGQAQLERLTIDPPPTDLETTTHHLRRVLLSINRLVEKRADLTDSELVERLLRLVEQSMQLAAPDAVSNDEPTS
ncbi:MAG: hypothetical protein KDI79_12475 [Anaerolineae bacterium]|nr:hypothetical protein [Anaerolineae bacterium]